MGARWVSATLHPHWSTLSDRAFRVLTIMAHTALDAPRNGQDAGIYWAGHEYLCAVIYGTDAPTESQSHMVKRAVRELVRAGAIEVHQAATGRRRARYRVTADQLPNPVDNPVDNGSKHTNRGCSDGPLFGADLAPYSGNRGPNDFRIGGTQMAPGGRKKEEERQEETEEPTQVPTQPPTATLPENDRCHSNESRPGSTSGADTPSGSSSPSTAGGATSPSKSANGSGGSRSPGLTQRATSKPEPPSKSGHGAGSPPDTDASAASRSGQAPPAATTSPRHNRRTRRRTRPTTIAANPRAGP